MISHSETGSHQVDAELALGTVGEAVAVARLTVGNQRSLHLTGKLEVVGWKYSGASAQERVWLRADLRLMEREEMLRLILLHTVTPTRGESSVTQGQE